MRLSSKQFKVLGFELLILIIFLLCQSCIDNPSADQFEKGSFGYDLAFLSKHQETIILKNGNARLAICPAYQGRVMTSSSDGSVGMSYGWINYNLIQSGEIPKHILPVGGEDRFWLGPEGGQFSLYFKPDKDFTFENWQTPAPIDSEPFPLVYKTEQSARFENEFVLENYNGNSLNFHVRREISFIDKSELEKLIPLSESMNYVAYQTKNTITNSGENPWTKSDGAPSIWILGMFNPSNKTTIVVPYRKGDEAELGPIVNDAYFGKVPEERLVIGDGVMYFSGDGKYRSKIGLNPRRALPFLGSYDGENDVLTIVHFTKPDSVEDYVNSMWELQQHPFAGDAANAYNDGPVDGKAMGPFYELESSSPAAFLAPGQSMTHVQMTIHIQGSEKELDEIVQKIFNTTIEQIKTIF